MCSDCCKILVVVFLHRCSLFGFDRDSSHANTISSCIKSENQFEVEATDARNFIIRGYHVSTYCVHAFLLVRYAFLSFIAFISVVVWFVLTDLCKLVIYFHFRIAVAVLSHDSLRVLQWDLLYIKIVICVLCVHECIFDWPLLDFTEKQLIGVISVFTLPEAYLVLIE